jgi:PadR family transcriptional regulator PadR
LCDHGDVDAGCCHANGHVEGAARSVETCCCGGKMPRHFTLPAVLLLLDKEPSHGYALFQKLSELGITGSGMSPATVYRVLSRLEEDGLATHENSDDGQGPTRKVYTLTEEGRKALAEWRIHIERMRGLLDWFVDKAFDEQAR